MLSDPADRALTLLLTFVWLVTFIVILTLPF